MDTEYSNREVDFMIKGITDKIDEVRVDLRKDIAGLSDAMEARFDGTNKKQDYTNGNVRLHEKLLWLALGALPLLTIWAGWLTNEVLSNQKELNPVQQSAITASVIKALDKYDINQH